MTTMVADVTNVVVAAAACYDDAVTSIAVTAAALANAEAAAARHVEAVV